jgi:hypothetical protein
MMTSDCTIVTLIMMAKRKRALKKKFITQVEEQGRWEYFF